MLGPVAMCVESTIVAFIDLPPQVRQQPRAQCRLQAPAQQCTPPCHEVVRYQLGRWQQGSGSAVQKVSTRSNRRSTQRCHTLLPQEIAHPRQTLAVDAGAQRRSKPPGTSADAQGFPVCIRPAHPCGTAINVAPGQAQGRQGLCKQQALAASKPCLGNGITRIQGAGGQTMHMQSSPQRQVLPAAPLASESTACRRARRKGATAA